MLKRSKKILLIFLGVLLISGCKAKSETSMIINDDKSITIKGIAGYDDELINAMMSMNESSSLEEAEEVKNYTDEEQRKFLEENFIDTNEAFSSMEDQGFTIQEYQDETYMGYVMSKNIKNIDDFVGDNPDLSISDYEDFNNKKMFKKEGNVYKGRILFNASETTDETETYNIELDYKFILTLPNKAISSNATSVSEDGKTLTWDLANTNIDAIEFEFEFPSFLTMIKDNMFIIAGIAVAIILIIVIIITIIITKSKKRKKNKKENNEKVNVQDSMMNAQSEVQPVMPQDSITNVQPEVQPVMPQDSVMNVQPEVQPLMSQDSVMNVQPEVQPVMPQDSVMNVQPEVQPVMPQDPIMNIQPEVQPVMSQDSVMNVQPEVQPMMSQDPVMNVQPEIKPIPQEPVVITDLETQATNTEQVISSQPLFPQDIVPPKDYN